MKILEITFLTPVQVPGMPGLRDRASSKHTEIALDGEMVCLVSGGEAVYVPFHVVKFFTAEVSATKAKGKKA